MGLMRWNLIIGDEINNNLIASASESTAKSATTKSAAKKAAKEPELTGGYLALHLAGVFKDAATAQAVAAAITADPLAGFGEFGKGLVKPKGALKGLLRAVLKAGADIPSDHPFIFIAPRTVTESQQDTTSTGGGKGEPRIFVVDIEFRIPMDLDEADRLLGLFEQNKKFANALAPYVNDTLRSWFAAIVG